MKKQFLRAGTNFGLLSILALAAFVSTARAQSPVNISVDVPFEFRVGDELMPAGRYTIRRAVRGTNAALAVAGDKGGGRVVALTASVVGREARRTMLVFHRYGGEYFLRGAWTVGETEGRAFSESKLERAARRDRRRIVRNGGGVGGPEVVEVTATR